MDWWAPAGLSLLMRSCARPRGETTVFIGWLKGRKGLIRTIDDSLQVSVAQVMADFQFMAKNRPGKNAADPWVVALAMITGATVVTEEGEDDSAKHPKIPLVFKHYGINFIRLLDLIRREGWRF